MNDLRTALPRLRLRPIQQDDLDALHAFAAASSHGLTTLPNDLQQLRGRIERSLHSFATNDVSGEESYLFVLEDLSAERVVGVSGISAQAGQSDRFY
ncbi:MAG: arginine N-succinyltransferase, partial [Pseudomonadota bacterium]|nr:arginine N-succinyltransferase [Pseudomonadota bacterium]